MPSISRHSNERRAGVTSLEVVGAADLQDQALDEPFSTICGLLQASFMLACGSGN